ncbi:MAG: carboxylating nicotinate-nucleotide diphosphorylase [Deltaproteobacteria bacterium]|nr:MAG: carboxylating nicotinate-nucleotide diphosphorylase [Deltaproteobacteria bacterium]
MEHSPIGNTLGHKLDHPLLDAWITDWLAEDLHHGDVTSWSVMPDARQAQGSCVAKQDLVLCGLPLFLRVLARTTSNLKVECLVEEGQAIAEGETLLRLEGEIHGILAGERLGLNLLQHLTGIATQARQFADAVAGTQARVVDTRKTLPGLRFLQRYAVRVGGCYNHRYDLGGGVLIKENHIRGAGSIAAAVQSAKTNAPHALRIEVEVTDFAEMREAIQAGADVVMLDNMTPNQCAQAVSEVEKKVILEASGGIHLGNVRDYAEAGVDIISVGALTHSIQAADISLLLSS